jgi:hypothetical protein
MLKSGKGTRREGVSAESECSHLGIKGAVKDTKQFPLPGSE